MDDLQDPTEARLEALEIKAAYQEDSLDRLSEQVYKQQLQIERLQALVAELHGQLQSQGQPATLRSLLDDRPPHY